jgi:hypothetical protein
MWRVMAFSFVVTLVGAFVLDAVLDGTAFWIGLAVLGLLVGLSLRWVAPPHLRKPRRTA